jgi:hypothetical protein
MTEDGSFKFDPNLIPDSAPGYSFTLNLRWILDSHN